MEQRAGGGVGPLRRRNRPEQPHLSRLRLGFHIAQHSLLHFLHAFPGRDVALDAAFWCINERDVRAPVVAENLKRGAAFWASDMWTVEAEERK